MHQTTQSPLAPTRELEPFFEKRGVPVFCNVLWDTSSQAREAARGDISLGLCPETGLIFNRSFDPELVGYAPTYENSLHFSPRFQEFAESIVRRMQVSGLTDKHILEIGCGKAEFLQMLVAAGAKSAVGLDATAPQIVDDQRIEVLRCQLEEVADDLRADWIVCRHVLEHVADPIAFLRRIRAIAERSDDTRLYFEVPNGLWTFEKLGIWDLIYEHPSYFVSTALNAALERAGFVAEEIWSDFGGQYLCCIARTDRDGANRAEPQPGMAAPADTQAAVAELRKLTSNFADRHRLTLERWNERLADLRSQRAYAALWGAGSKGVTFLNSLDNSEAVEVVVDINPRKHGKHVPCTAQPVVGPEDLIQFEPDLVLVMNPLYEDEIRVECEGLGLDVRVEVV